MMDHNIIRNTINCKMFIDERLRSKLLIPPYHREDSTIATPSIEIVKISRVLWCRPLQEGVLHGGYGDCGK